VRYRDRINPAFFAPQVEWRKTRNVRNLQTTVQEPTLETTTA
jgi:hypothetical protein